jgi:predicted deacetylase
MFHALGLNPVGFVPPAWLAREDAFAAADASGLLVSEDASGVRVHARHQHVRAPAIRWSGRTEFRAHVSALVASSRWRMQRHRSLLRLALHPQDLMHPVTARSVHREVERWFTVGPVVQYAEL